MQIEDFRVSNHATQRMAQRNLGAREIYTVLQLGRITHRTGARFYFLGRRDIPQGRERELEHLVGTTIIEMQGEIITIYRNRQALPVIKRKSKHRSQ